MENCQISTLQLHRYIEFLFNVHCKVFVVPGIRNVSKKRQEDHESPGIGM